MLFGETACRAAEMRGEEVHQKDLRGGGRESKREGEKREERERGREGERGGEGEREREKRGRKGGGGSGG